MPSDRLSRGQRATVEVTDGIRQLVKIGAVVVVAGDLDAPAPEPEPEPEPQPTVDDPEPVKRTRKPRTSGDG